MEKQPQVFRVTLCVEQQCKNDMTEKEMKEWVQKHFNGSEYGSVTVTDVEQYQ